MSDDPDRPVIVHGVQHLIHSIDTLDRWPSNDKRTRLVVIGRNLNVEAMRAILTSSRPKQRAVSSGLFKAAIAGGLLTLGVTASATWLAAQSPETTTIDLSRTNLDRSTP